MKHEWIKERIDELDKRQSDIAREIGLPSSRVNEIIAGSRGVKGEEVHLLAEALEMTVKALLKKLYGVDIRVDPPPTKTISLESTQSQVPMISIIELDVRAMGGPGAMSDNDNHEDVLASWTMPKEIINAHTTAPKERIRIIQVVGDSMIPDFMPGDRVMVDTEDRLPSPPGVFVVWDGLGLVIKRLEFIDDHDDGPMVEMISRNDEYKRRYKRPDDIEINGRVIGKWLWT